jgi:hypothetical protein
MIDRTWMDDIELGLMSLLQVHIRIVFRLQLQVERQKNECWAFLHTMSTPQLQVLLSKHDNNHCVMLYKHWYAWFWF